MSSTCNCASACFGSSAMTRVGEAARICRRSCEPKRELSGTLIYSDSNGRSVVPRRAKPQAASALQHTSAARMRRTSRCIGLTNHVYKFARHNNDPLRWSAFKEFADRFVRGGLSFDLVLAGAAGYTDRPAHFAVYLKDEFDFVQHQGRFVDFGPRGVEDFTVLGRVTQVAPQLPCNMRNHRVQHTQ